MKIRTPLELVPLLALAIAGCAAGDAASDRGRGPAGGKADEPSTGSCASGADTFCGGQSAGTCFCDDRCAGFHDCCVDAAPVCGVDSNRLEDRTAGKEPLLGPDDLEIVASLPYPPGNVAVTPDGRTFLSYFPDSNGGLAKVVELVDGQPVAFPRDLSFHDRVDTVLGIRLDRQGRLWLLDHATAGLGTPKLIAIDVATQAVVVDYRFRSSDAGLGSLLNDLVISPEGDFVYISDLSPLRKRPAIVVVDVRGPAPVVTRRLEQHASVVDGGHDVFVNDREVRFKAIRPTFGIDGIALDRTGAFVYYAALNGGTLYRVPTAALRDPDPAVAVAAVEPIGDATMSDGMIADDAGAVYLTDMEHFAITRVDAAGRLDVVARDRRLRWPDGFSWGPGGALYVSASALHQFMHELILTPDDVAANAPYHVFRLYP